LIWKATTTAGEQFVGLPGPMDRVSVITTRDEVVELPQNATVALWHPIEADEAELRQVRDLISRRQVRQPIRQAWRETFRPDPIELGTALYSNRYSGHILRFKQFFGLLRRKGWGGGFLSGAWDGGQSANPTRAFPDYGLRAVLTIADRDWEWNREIDVELCATDRLQFEPADLPVDLSPPPVPIPDIPAVVFSETMRDLDFFVASCSIATDPTWLEMMSGERRLAEYWNRVAADGLGTTVRTRREAVAELLDLGVLQGPYELTTHSLVVLGTLGRYVIDLATANVCLDPPRRWLSMRNPPSSVAYPWEEASAVDDDEILWRILARATALASDNEITDKRLLAQLRAAK
jgi:hypothetical protein